MGSLMREISATVGCLKRQNGWGEWGGGREKGERVERSEGSFVPANFAKTLLHSFKVALILSFNVHFFFFFFIVAQLPFLFL